MAPSVLSGPFLALRVKDLPPSPLFKADFMNIRPNTSSDEPECFAASFGRAMGAGRLQPIGPFSPMCTAKGAEVQFQEIVSGHYVCGMGSNPAKQIMSNELLQNENSPENSCRKLCFSRSEVAQLQ